MLLLCVYASGVWVGCQASAVLHWEMRSLASAHILLSLVVTICWRRWSLTACVKGDLLWSLPSCLHGIGTCFDLGHADPTTLFSFTVSWAGLRHRPSSSQEGFTPTLKIHEQQNKTQASPKSRPPKLPALTPCLPLDDRKGSERGEPRQDTCSWSHCSVY